MKIWLILVLFVDVVSVSAEPLLLDHNLVVEKLTTSLSEPTTMAFVGHDILILQKNDGKVYLIKNGTVQEKPVLDLNVSNNSERGLLGIVTVNSTVFLYFTESEHDGGEPLGNRIYQFLWDGQDMTEPKLIKDLPATPGPNHDGGILVKGRDETVYAVIGDLNRNGALQNYADGVADDTSVILQIMPEGPYRAIGIRNSFGLAMDPVTGNLWDTENGPQAFDEINLVVPNFNSGWEKIMGPAVSSQILSLPGYSNYTYSDPEFSWQQVVAPTALTFINSSQFTNLNNSLLVGDCNFGNIYKFDLNMNRTGFVFSSKELLDNVANLGESAQEIKFGTGFGCITDIKIGPDGFLYVVSLSEGTIFKIMSISNEIKNDSIKIDDQSQPIEFVIYYVIAIIVISILTYVIILKKKKNLGM